MARDQSVLQDYVLRPVYHLHLHRRRAVFVVNSYHRVIVGVYAPYFDPYPGLGSSTFFVKTLVSGSVFCRVCRVIDDVLGVRSRGLNVLIDGRCLWVPYLRRRIASG
jgi:hypothetical protein